MTSFIDQYVQPVADFVAHHPLLGSVIVFLLALSESLPVIGAVSPGTATILAISALAGLGYMPVWAVLAAALLGAIAGDGLAYWFGHRYKAHALEIWPMAHYPRMIESSQAFFARHGGKSILIARFTPVVRAFVPLIAGISGMSPARFYSANIGSAVVWSFSHIIPAAAAFVTVGAWHVLLSHARGLKMYAPQAQTRPMTSAEWRQLGWRDLPAYRVDLGGENEEPIILQWSGTITDLRNALAPHGWQPAVGVGFVTAGTYLRGNTTPELLPVLPRLNDGRAPALSLVRSTGPDGGREILNIWTSNVVLSDRGARPILVGAILLDRLNHPLPFLTLPTPFAASPADAIAKLADVLPGTLHVTRPSNAWRVSPMTVLLAGP